MSYLITDLSQNGISKLGNFTSNIKSNIMKKVIFMSFMAVFLSLSVSSCREQSEKERVIEEMNDKGAEVKVKRDGDKIKMETDDKKVKIKTDNDGNVKIKEKTKNDDN